MINWLVRLFRSHDVMLVDNDGEITFAKSYRKGGMRFANRYGHTVVQLLPDGRIVGCAYVKRWEELK